MAEGAAEFVAGFAVIVTGAGLDAAGEPLMSTGLVGVAVPAVVRLVASAKLVTAAGTGCGGDVGLVDAIADEVSLVGGPGGAVAAVLAAEVSFGSVSPRVQT